MGSLQVSPRQKGFTLVELTMAMVLLGILAAVGSTIVADSFTSTRMVNADSASMAEARYAIERLAREIREVKYVSSSGSGSYAISTMSSSQMVFTRVVGGADVTVTISRSGSVLALQYSSPSATSNLSGQVSGFSLSYLNASGVATTDTSAIRFVDISLTVADSVSGKSISQRTRVALRNA